MGTWKRVIVFAALGSAGALAISPLVGGDAAAAKQMAPGEETRSGAAPARSTDPADRELRQGITPLLLERSAGDGHPEVRFDRIRLANGVTLHYAESGPEDGEPMILLHGYSDSWFSFSRLLPRLPEHVRAIALDQRGHGDSERPAAGYGARDFAGDVVAFMDAKGIGRATIVGHSMGGFVAQWVVAAAPERVARLVIMGSATVPGTFAGMDEFGPMVSALTDPVPMEFIRAFQESTLHVPVPKRFLEEVITESAKLPAHVWKGVMDELMTAPAPGGLAKHRIPTLILWGEKDAYAPRAQQDALISQHGTGVLRIYRGTGHAPHWERPEEVAWDLWAFMRMEPAPAR